jgi:hypothetical protein
MRRLRPLRTVLSILGIALGLAVTACLLPERPYERWQLLDGTIHERARWIYERVHFDPRPIDVMFVGPSRTARGVDPLQLQDLLSSPGRPVRVVNFALPENGRNMNEVIVEEALKTKTPKLIVIGVIEKPSRFGHPAYKYIAPRHLMVNPGYLANADYLSDLVYLPFRQMKLALAYAAPQAMGLTDQFDPGRYDPDPPNPTSVVKPDGSVEDWTQPGTPQELQRGINKLERGMHPPILPASLADIEFGDERHYIRQIVAAAQKKGVKVAFLSLPYCTGPSGVQEEKFYRQYGPVWNAGFLSSHTELYADYGHLTIAGAKVLTTWLAPYVAQSLGLPQASVTETSR